MAKVYAVINRKGGVGKTTTSLAMAWLLNQNSNKSLLVDLDQQHNSTTMYGAQTDDVATIYDVLTDSSLSIEEAIQTSSKYGDIIAGDDLLNNIEAEMAALPGRDFMLADALDNVSNEYDYIIIDCPTALGVVATNALIAADEVIIPVLCGDEYSVDGLKDLIKIVNNIQSNRRLNPELSIAGALLTQYEFRSNVANSVNNKLQIVCNELSIPVFDDKIRKCCKVKEAQSEKVSLFEAYPQSNAALDYTWWIEDLTK